MADKTVFCPSCQKTFTAWRYFSSHLRYKANIKCKEVHERKSPSPAKRPASSTTVAAALPLVTPATGTNKRPCTAPVCNVDKTTANVMEAVILEDAAARVQIFGELGQETCVNNQESSCVNNSNNIQNSAAMETDILHDADDSDDNNNLPAPDSDSEEEDEGLDWKIPQKSLHAKY